MRAPIMTCALPRLPDYPAFSRDALDDELCLLCSHLYAAEYRLLTASASGTRASCGACTA